MCANCVQLDDSIRDIRTTLARTGLEPKVVKLLNESVDCIVEQKKSFRCLKPTSGQSSYIQVDGDQDARQSLELLELFLSLNAEQRLNMIAIMRAAADEKQ